MFEKYADKNQNMGFGMKNSPFLFMVKVEGDEALGRRFIEEYMASPLVERDRFFAQRDFDPSSSFAAQVLIDTIYCVDQNLGERVSIVESDPSGNFSMLKVYKKRGKLSGFFGGGDTGPLLFAVPLGLVRDYVAQPTEVIFRMKDGSLASIAEHCSMSSAEYDDVLRKFHVSFRE